MVVCLENSAKVRAIGVAELVPYSSLDEVRNRDVQVIAFLRKMCAVLGVVRNS